MRYLPRGSGATLGHTSRMKRWGVIAAVTAFTIFAVADLVYDFVTNDPIGYFSSEPHRLLYVAAIAIAGALAALGFYRLSPRAQRHVRVFAWGATASTMTVATGYFVFRFLSLSSFIGESGGTMRVLLSLLFFFGIAAYFWFEFWRTRKTGASQ
jgi:hypothetical protein